MLATRFVAILLLSGSVLSAGCASAARQPLQPWTDAQLVAEAAPHDQPGLWSDGETTLLAWPGEPAAPGIRLAALGAEPKILPLGRVPREVRLLHAADNNLHVLWLDQTLPGETHLAGAVIQKDGAILRDPGAISKRPAAQYSAVTESAGDALTLWTDTADRPAIYFQRLDGLGRPSEAVRLSAPATDPGIAIDLNGNIHLAWLEPHGAQGWTIQYAFVRASDVNALQAVQTIPVGIILPGYGQSLESFSLGLDSTHVYCLWSLTRTGNNDPHWPNGTMAGLTFPITDDSATSSLKFDQQLDLHWPSMPDRTLPSLTIAVTARLWDGQAWHDVPAAMVITPQAPGILHQVFASGDTSLIGKTTLLAASDGALDLAWTALRPDGTAGVYYATTR